MWYSGVYIKEADQRLGDGNIYEKIPNNPASLIKTINTVLAKIRKRGHLKRERLHYFVMQDPQFGRFCFLSKIYKDCIMSQVDL